MYICPPLFLFPLFLCPRNTEEREYMYMYIFLFLCLRNKEKREYIYIHMDFSFLYMYINIFIPLSEEQGKEGVHIHTYGFLFPLFSPMTHSTDNATTPEMNHVDKLKLFPSTNSD